jgi:hypothetical protein
MMHEVSDQPAQPLEITGLSEDGWCEPRVELTIAVDGDARMCQFDVWLPEGGRTTSRFSIRLTGEEPFAFDAPHGVLFTVQTACRAVPGEIIDAVIECDHEVQGTGGDERRLSFKLHRLLFF